MVHKSASVAGQFSVKQHLRCSLTLLKTLYWSYRCGVPTEAAIAQCDGAEGENRTTRSLHQHTTLEGRDDFSVKQHLRCSPALLKTFY
jgi:hypothetical protein